MNMSGSTNNCLYFLFNPSYSFYFAVLGTDSSVTDMTHLPMLRVYAWRATHGLRRDLSGQENICDRPLSIEEA
jgi:hypothetical protein